MPSTITGSDILTPQINVDNGTLFVDSANNRVGVGTSSPNDILHISGGNGPRLRITDTDTNGDVALRSFKGNGFLLADADVGFFPGSGEAMRITSSGNVGIGTSSPDGELHIIDRNGDAYLTLETEGDGNAAGIFFKRERKGNEVGIGGGAIWMPSDTDSDHPQIHFSVESTMSFPGNLGSIPSGGDIAMTIGNRNGDSGNVGIGTVSPSSTLDVNGSLSKNSGSFRIDHPLPEKSETHQLVHSFVESPLADNIYRGTATLTNGAAQVNIDAYVGMTEGTFSALNGNPQIFLQNESGFEPVKGNVADNILYIQCRDETATDIISWMVVGERQDQHMLDTQWTDEFGRPVLEPEKELDEEDELDSDGKVIEE